ncbi:MAG: sulfatase-like hydrolase/transferase [Planctomycetota bacterium]|nr:sulfatase-like hydrolase/transferase [Planctomycetota bacterium]
MLILADDLGFGDIGCYNPRSKIPTPNIDRLASQGLRFTDAHSPASVCVPTRYSLLTGRYSHRRPNRNGSFNAGALIDEGIVTLPAMLAKAGYRTDMLGKWHLGFDFTSFDDALAGGPVDRGFASYFGVPASTDIPPYFFIEDDHAVEAPTAMIDEHHSEGVRNIQGAFYREGKIAPGLKLPEVLPTFAERALARIEENAKSPETPFFTYLALTAPHTPWLPAKKFHGRSSMRAEGVPPALADYGDFVANVDDIVGQVLDRLDELSIADRTLVIFTSDNGPTWYDDDAELTGHDSAGPWRGMKGDVWEAGHRVPLIIRWPAHVPADETSDALIGQVDFFATLAALVGQKLAKETAPDSHNLLPVLLGHDGATGRETLITQSSQGVLSLRKGSLKFIPHLGSAGFSEPKREKPTPGGPTVQLYDLANDPGETTNLAGERPNVVAELTALLERLQTAERTAP